MWKVAGGRGRYASGGRPARRFVTIAPSSGDISILDIVTNIPAAASAGSRHDLFSFLSFLTSASEPVILSEARGARGAKDLLCSWDQKAGPSRLRRSG